MRCGFRERSVRTITSSPQGPYIELRGRHRSFPQEDFFGLGPDSQLSNRSDFALHDTLGRVTGGYERGRLQTGIGLGYLDASIGAGTDARMPSSTEIFTIDEMPGVSDRGGFLVIEPFVEYASIDPAIGDHSGGRYRLSVAEYRDRNTTDIRSADGRRISGNT